MPVNAFIEIATLHKTGLNFLINPEWNTRVVQSFSKQFKPARAAEIGYDRRIGNYIHEKRVESLFVFHFHIKSDQFLPGFLNCYRTETRLNAPLNEYFFHFIETDARQGRRFRQ